MACSVAGRNGYAAIRVSIVGNVFYHSKGLTGCTGGPLVSGPAGRHRLHAPLARSRQRTRWPSPLAGCSSPLAGCTSPVARHVSGPAPGRHRLHVTSWPVARQRTRWPSPLAGCSSRLNVTGCPAGRLLVTFERHPLAVTGCTSPLAGCTSADPSRWPSPAGRLLVTFERTRCPAGRHRLHVTRWPVARQRTRWPSPLAGCSSRQRTRWPSPLAGCSSPVARHVSGPVAPLAVTRWPVARHV